MEEKLKFFSQTNNIAFWLNINTNLDVNIIYSGEGDFYSIDVSDSKGEVFAYNIDALSLKGEKRLNFEFGTIITVLLNLKESYNVRRE